MIKPSIGSRVFDCFNYIVLLLMGIICVIPFIYVVSASFTPPEELIKYNFILFPKKPTLMAYKYIFSTSTITRSLFVSVFVTVVGTMLNVGMTALMAYPLAHKRILGHKVLMLMVTFTLVFSGGMIPGYILVQKLHLLNTYAAPLLPSAISAFNLIIFKNFFQQLPEELEESAKIDGCSDLRILGSIILPISVPLLATFTVIFAVGHWNSWFGYVLYINDAKKWPVQVVLRMIVASANSQIGNKLLMEGDYTPPQDIIRMCIITIATVPILVVYPFVQKYFTQGILLGSVKG